MRTIITLIFLLQLFTVNIFAQLTESENTVTVSDLIFSEYIEGTSNNKALEIYNGTGQTVNLDNYLIAWSINGGGWVNYHNFPVGATLADGDVWVMITDQVDPLLFNAANADEVLAYPSVIHFNGDDARALCSVSATDTVIIDVFGIPDVDPGFAWDVADITEATHEYTLIRKEWVTSGNTDWTLSAGTNQSNSEWVVLPQNTFEYLGYHPHVGLNTADVTFNVNMNYQISSGNFTPGVDFVDLAGNFNSWGSPGDLFTDSDGDGIYSLNLSDFYLGDTIEFKCRINGDWNTYELSGLASRSLIISQPSETIYFWYNDEMLIDTASIFDIQSSIDSIGSSLYEGQIINTSGIVTAVSQYGYFIQDGTGAWNGIYVYDPANFPVIGDEIEITAEVDEYFDMTELKNISAFSVISVSNQLPLPYSITSLQLSSDESFEGVLVNVNNVACTNTLSPNNEWTVNDGSGDCIVDDGIYFFTPDYGNIYNITGVVNYSYNEFRLYPRDTFDIIDITATSILNANLTWLSTASDYYNTGTQNIIIYFDLANTGGQTIYDCELNYSIDNSPTLYSNNALSVFTGAIANLEFNQFNYYSSPGIHNVSIWITGLNGQQIPVGDTLNYTFEVINISNPAYCYMSYPFREFVLFDLSDPSKLVIVNDNPMPADNVISATWYNNHYLGVKNGSDELVSFDQLSGSYTIIGPMGVDIRGLSYDYSNNILYGIENNGSLYNIDLNTGAATLIFQGSSSGFKTLACDLSGNLFSLNSDDDNLYSINPSTGAATQIGYIGYDAVYTQSLEFDRNAGVLYLSSFDNSVPLSGLRIVNTVTGLSTSAGNYPLIYGIYNPQLIGLAIPYSGINPSSGDYALNLDGVDEYLKPWGNLSAQSGDFTYEVWINPTEINNYHEIIHWREDSYGIQLRVNPDGSILYGESGPGIWLYVISSEAVDTAQWSHIAVTRDGDICSIYINGVLSAMDLVGAGLPLSNFNIGGREWNMDRFFNGSIDDIRIWNTARSGSQIYSDMCSGTISDPSLMYRWQFSEGFGNIHAIDDVTGRQLILSNMETNSGIDCDWIDNVCDIPVVLNADFTADILYGEAPLSVNFSDLSTGAITDWLWDFGDGSYSSDQNPAHIYQNPGLYTVSLIVSDANSSDTLEFMNYIEVISPSLPGPDWTVINTGVSHTILIQSSTPITIDGIQISSGDYIGVFYDSLGTLACAGYDEWTGQSLALTAWGDDAQTTEPDGFASGEIFTFIIFRISDGSELIATASYMQPPVMPNTDAYTSNGMSGLTALSALTVEYQYIDLPQGWCYFSSYIDPFEANIDSLCGPFVSDVIIAKDGNGNTYWPQWGINSIGNIIIGDGYQIKLAVTHTMEIAGLAVQPESTPIIIPQGWSILGYLRQNNAPIDLMLGSFINEVIIVKNSDGQIFWPQWGINAIVNMFPGEGYLIKMNTQQTLTYPANSVVFTKQQSISLNPKTYTLINKSGTNMTLGIPFFAWDSRPQYGSEVGVFSESGLLVGADVFTNQNMAISIWGNDEYTNKNDGLISNEEFIIKVLDISSGIENIITINSWLEGDNIYSDNKISVINSLTQEQNNCFLFQNTPNPFKAETVLRFYLPENTFTELRILNILGEEIEVLVSRELNKGEHSIIYNNSTLSDGSYFYQLRTDNYLDTRKMIILKR